MVRLNQPDRLCAHVFAGHNYEVSALPAIAIEGPKGVGKTLTAMQRSKSVERLDTDVPGIRGYNG
jgi:Cdc6-like AAA superfamily ATPase